MSISEKERENFLYEVKELIDFHLTDFVHLDGQDCGCIEEEQQEWADRWKSIGDQAFNDHLYAKIKEAMEASFECP
jgi:hypothetical protein